MQTGHSIDYNDFAKSYAQTRWAVPWIVDPLICEVDTLSTRSIVVEIGCGTGNYIITLSQKVSDKRYQGFDLSEEMLAVARSRQSAVEFTKGNAEVKFPYPDAHCHLVFAVDVIHHLNDLDTFFAEAARILKTGSRLVVVTDSEDDIRNRSLTVYFPETLKNEAERYPTLVLLDEKAHVAGLSVLGHETIEGVVDLNDDFILKLKEKCASALRLISSEAHQQGIERVRIAKERGESWYSCYTLAKYIKA
jgi:SAM-dependent methyltransferase